MSRDLFTADLTPNTAVISECGLYRYRLTRTWDGSIRPAAFVMLNPSTADAATDDPTIRRCVGFAKSWGCGGIVVVNLFAYRATNPGAMRRQGPKAVGPDNDRYIREAITECAPVVAAWGSHGCFLCRDSAVGQLIRCSGLPWPECLGTTKHGSPRHPLYVPAIQTLEPWDVRI